MRKQWKAVALSAIVGVSTFAGVLGVDIAMRLSEIEQHRATLELNTDRAASIIRDRVHLVKAKLRDASVVMRRAKRLDTSTTDAIHGYIDEIALFEEYPEIRAIGFHRLVTEAEADRAVDAYNADPMRAMLGYPPLRLRGSSDHPLRAMVAIMVPLASAERQIGFDLMATPRRTAIERAIARRRTQLTERITLFSDEPGVVFFHPVFDNASDLIPVGFMAAAFATDQFLQDLGPALAPLALKIEIRDLGPTDEISAHNAPPTVLATGRRGHAGRAAASMDPQTEVMRDIALAGRTWRVVASSQEPPPPPVWRPDAFMALGAIIALLVSALIYRAKRSADVLTEQVAIKTKDLRAAAESLDAERVDAEYRAAHDDLTGLLNRRGFLRGAQGAEALCRFHDGHLALIHIDLDGFKEVNDALGHTGGDALLQLVAERLSALAPDGAVVGRLGGDEFVMTWPVADLAEAEVVGQAFLDWARRPQTLGDREVRFGASIGVASTHESGRMVEQLVIDADIALYAAKDAGKNRMMRFGTELRQNAQETKALSEDLKRAVLADEFEPYFQTQHDVLDNRIVGLEALVRWRHPSRGVLPPAAFLKQAENVGLMQEIDRRVMQKAVDAMLRFEQAGFDIPKVSVNVSLHRLQDPELLCSIDALPKMKANLHFEIVETVFFDDPDEVTSWGVDALRERGVNVEMDDFGTGHASVVALTRLAPTTLKIDRELIMPLLDHPQQVRLVSSIVEMGRALDIMIIAEGVETLAHADALRTIGVDALQGYAFSKPVSADELLERLRRAA